MMKIRVGDSFTVGPFKAQLTDGTVLDLTGAKIEASVATARGATPLFTRQNAAAGGSDAEILVQNAVEGTFIVLIPTSQSSQMTAEVDYYLDARVKTATGLVATVGEAKWHAVAAYTPVPTP